MNNRKGSEKNNPSRGCAARMEGHMENIEETRDQTMKKIEYHLPTLTDAQLRLVNAFIRGIKKNQG